MRTIEIKLFGAYKKYVPSGKINLQIKHPLTAVELKNLIQDSLIKNCPAYLGQNLVFESALATSSEIITDEEKTVESEVLALLPPVCGG